MKTFKSWLAFRLVQATWLWVPGAEFFENEKGAGPWVPRWGWVGDLYSWTH